MEPRPVALVTGASAGLGEEFARQLARRNHDVVLVARDAARLEALAADLRASLGVGAEVLAADLTVDTELAAVEERARTVDLLVNNAGFGTFGPFHSLDVEAEERMVRLNVLAVLRLTHAAAAAMAERGRGGILNVSSLAGYQPGPRNATYGATKAFVTSFTQAVHEELRGSGVAVTVCCPGFTHTEFQARAAAPASDVPDFLWQDPPEVVRAALDGVAANRAVVVPGAVNKVLGAVSGTLPHSVTRRVSSFNLERAAR
ncbi:MAG: SDR family NAD(P)-dependent oxidoreductase [Actinomycetota bacterium]